MADHFKLEFEAALIKAGELYQKDYENVKIEGGEFDMKSQIQYLINAYTEIDPDTCLTYLSAVEENENILAEDAKFIILKYTEWYKFKNDFPCDLSVETGRFTHLMEKYKLANVREDGGPYDVASIAITFPREAYNLKIENPSLCWTIPNDMRKYKKFKKEYDVDAILALLPSGKKYGGFVKAFLYLQNLRVSRNTPALKRYSARLFQVLLAKFRTIYHSKTFSEETRLEWFEKLGISEDDCRLWSRLFDKQYPAYKEIHKFFGQTE